jgi:hypothetical protein
MIKYLFFLFIFLSACKKAENRACIKARGENASKQISLPSFDRLILKKGMRFLLVQDKENYLNIIGGKNLLNFISFNVLENGEIEIQNTNKCNFLRKYSSDIMVEIHFKSLKEIRFEGTEELSSKDTLNLLDFKFIVIDACGTFNITLKANYLEADIPYGYGNYILSGTVENAYLQIKSNGFCNTEKLKILNELSVNNESQGDMYINADQKILNGSIKWKGNIYYKGKLKGDELKYYDTGKLINY